MKYKHLFTNKFYRENARDGFMAQDIAHFTIKLIDDDADETLENLVIEESSPERIASKDAEAKSIAELSCGSDIIRRMRKDIDPLNSRIFLSKALEFEDEIGAEILQMMKKSGNDAFIEAATRFLSKCRHDHSAELMEIFDEIRNSYAQSMMLVVIGFRGDEEAIPWIYDKYFKFKDSKHDEGDRAQGALVALDELFDRFYA